MTCATLRTGDLELYWYGELAPEARMRLRAHVEGCLECRHGLEELNLIRAALAGRPDVSSPAGGDWSAFMARVSEATAAPPRPAALVRAAAAVAPSRRRVVPYLALAALLSVVTLGVAMVLRDRPVAPVETSAGAGFSPESTPGTGALPDPGLVSLSDGHFQRSKLVLLGLTTRDTAAPGSEDWGYERDLASALLNDTRVYRLAVEARGMSNLAGVMRDLEMVLLQTSMSEEPDRESLETIQRLIRRRDLLTRMNVVQAGGY